MPTSARPSNLSSISSSRHSDLKPPSTLIVIGFFALAAAILWMVHRNELYDWWLQDVPVYQHAFHDYMAGRNPYNASMSPYFFLYPPVFLYLAALVWHLTPAHWGGFVFLAANAGCAIALPVVLARYYFRQIWLSPLFAVLLFFAWPRYTGTIGFCVMNIATILFTLAFAAAVPGIKRNRWEWFYLAVLLAGCIKITFLALLLLPLLAGRRQWLRSIGCGVAVIVVNVIQRLLTPGLYGGYQWALAQGIMGAQHYGHGIFGLLATFRHKVGQGAGIPAYAAYAVLAALQVVMMVRMRQRLDKAGDSGAESNLAANGIWLAMIVSFIILINPREMDYDVDMAMVGTFVLWAYGLGTRRILLLMSVLFLIALPVPLVVHNLRLQGIYDTLLAWIGFGLAYRRLWRETGGGAGRGFLEFRWRASLKGLPGH